jgi:hypothetical protein
MNTITHLAEHSRQVHFGGNWTVSNLKEVLEDVSWEEAVAKVHNFNTIATLVYHINYFVVAVSTVLRGEPLNASDKLSFDHPPITSESDWRNFVEKVLTDGEAYYKLIQQLPEDRLGDDFSDPKYGSYLRNLLGVIEHTHYHLGQIVILKRIVKDRQL